MSRDPNIQWTEAKLEKFQRLYKRAVVAGEKKVVFEGHEILLPYAAYLIEYLDNHFGRFKRSNPGENNPGGNRFKDGRFMVSAILETKTTDELLRQVLRDADVSISLAGPQRAANYGWFCDSRADADAVFHNLMVFAPPLAKILMYDSGNLVREYVPKNLPGKKNPTGWGFEFPEDFQTIKDADRLAKITRIANPGEVKHSFVDQGTSLFLFLIDDENGGADFYGVWKANQIDAEQFVVDFCLNEDSEFDYLMEFTPNNNRTGALGDWFFRRAFIESADFVIVQATRSENQIINENAEFLKIPERWRAGKIGHEGGTEEATNITNVANTVVVRDQSYVVLEPKIAISSRYPATLWLFHFRSEDGRKLNFATWKSRFSTALHSVLRQKLLFDFVNARKEKEDWAKVVYAGFETAFKYSPDALGFQDYESDIEDLDPANVTFINPVQTDGLYHEFFTKTVLLFVPFTNEFVNNGYLDNANEIAAEIGTLPFKRDQLRPEEAEDAHSSVRHKEWLEGKPEGKRLSHKSASLWAEDFSSEDLTDADFEGADLREAVFYGTNLIRTNFRGADLRWARFSDATLKDVDFTDADLREADFTGATVINPHLDGARLEKVVGLDIKWRRNKAKRSS